MSFDFYFFIFRLSNVLSVNTKSLFKSLLQQQQLFFMHIPAKNTVLSPNFLTWKFCEKLQFLHSDGIFCIAFVKLDYFTIISQLLILLNSNVQFDYK